MHRVVWIMVREVDVIEVGAIEGEAIEAVDNAGYWS
jgi:hypothetical protein